jgi:dUTP pyrophosphatase
VIAVKFSGTMPARATRDAAGYDLFADHPQTILPGSRALVMTGTKVEIPPGWSGEVCPRSGLAIKHGVTVLNAPGIIDADYRGEIGVILANMGAQPFEVKYGDRIAQLVFRQCASVMFVDAAMSETNRGEGGFGSTGK